jgi:TrmH family RNA methyltransferase
MNLITSKNNDFIKQITKLKISKYRNKEQLFLIESIKVIDMALDSHYKVKHILYDENKLDNFKKVINKAVKENINIVATSSDVMEKITYSQVPQGIVAVCEMKQNDTSSIKSSFIIACETLSDPGNMGTIIRTADAVGVGVVLLSNDCVDIYNDKVLRASMGSVFNIDIIKAHDFIEEIKHLQQKGYKAGCGHLDGSNFFTREKHEKTILIIGNESKGISDKVADICDFKWKIPMKGNAESLNAAVAAGIMMYDIMREE